MATPPETMLGHAPSWAECSAAGMTFAEAAAARGQTVGAAYTAARRHKLPFRRLRGVTKRTRLSWRQCEDLGMTAEEAAAARGVTRGAAYKAATEKCIAFAPAPKGRRPSRRPGVHVTPIPAPRMDADKRIRIWRILRAAASDAARATDLHEKTITREILSAAYAGHLRTALRDVPPREAA